MKQHKWLVLKCIHFLTVYIKCMHELTYHEDFQQYLPLTLIPMCPSLPWHTYISELTGFWYTQDLKVSLCVHLLEYATQTNSSLIFELLQFQHACNIFGSRNNQNGCQTTQSKSNRSYKQSYTLTILLFE